MSTHKIELEIIALSHSVSQSHSYAVVLGELNGSRRIPIVIGSAEAQAIAIALERVKPGRPLTHDLMKNIMLAYHIQLQEVYIHKLEEGIFYSKLICQNDDGIIEIDSRTSDAIALAVRFSAPIFTTEQILINAGLILNESGDEGISELLEEAESKGDNAFDGLTLNELQEKLAEVLDQEDYHMAAIIRDEIKRREGLDK
jgi:uncharacterized protein